MGYVSYVYVVPCVNKQNQNLNNTYEKRFDLARFRGNSITNMQTLRL